MSFLFFPRQNHNQQDLYKPSRSPLQSANPSRYPFPSSPQLQPQVAQLTAGQRYNLTTPVSAVTVPPPPTGYRDYRQHNRISLLHSEYGIRPREMLHQHQPPGGGGGASAVHHLEGIPPGLVAQQTHSQQQPFKKIRLQEAKELQPLRIDTRVSI